MNIDMKKDDYEYKPQIQAIMKAVLELPIRSSEEFSSIVSHMFSTICNLSIHYNISPGTFRCIIESINENYKEAFEECKKLNEKTDETSHT